MVPWLGFITTILGGQADARYFKNKADLSIQAKLDLKLRLSLAKLKFREYQIIALREIIAKFCAT